MAIIPNLVQTVLDSSPNKPIRDVVPLGSSFLQDAQYNQQSQELTITMKNGNVYAYQGVPQSVAEGLFQASSKGRYYNQQIKEKFASSHIVDMNVGPRIRNPLRGPTKK